MFTLYINKPFHKNIKIVTNDSFICDIFVDLYSNYISNVELSQYIEINVKKENNYYYIKQGINDIKTNSPIQVLENLIFDLIEIQDNIFALHAGAVSHNDKAFVFAASTNIGKTTLTAFLSLNGFDYVTDDCVFIDMQNNDVYPYHKPIHLREGGLQVLKNYNTTIQNFKFINIQTLQRYIFTPPNISLSKLKIADIFFIERTNNENSITNISTYNSLLLLIKSPIKSYKLTHEYLNFLHLISNKCKLLKYSDMNYVLNYLKAVI
jgi:hypothetical protein